MGELISKDYLVSVEALHFATDDYTLFLDGRDNAVLFTGDDSGAVTEDEGTPAMGTLTATDFDGDDGIVAVLTETASTGGYGTYTVDASGAWTYTLDDSLTAVPDLNSGETLTDTFDVVAEDGTVETVEITINGTDDVIASPFFDLSSGTEFTGTDGVLDNFVYDLSTPVGATINITNFDIGEDRLVFTNTSVYGDLFNYAANFICAGFGFGFEVYFADASLVGGIFDLVQYEPSEGGGFAILDPSDSDFSGPYTALNFLNETGSPEDGNFDFLVASQGDFDLRGPTQPLPLATDPLDQLAADNLFVFYENDLILV